jgi:hypothetical protein
MKHFLSSILLAGLITMAGCGDSTTGGPDAKVKDSNRPVTNTGGGTFTLSNSPDSMSVKQGEAKAFTVSINRKDNFQEDVRLSFEQLPKGVIVDPANPIIKHGDKEVKFTIKTADDAALGEFKVNMIGHPTKGLDSVSELKINIDMK